MNHADVDSLDGILRALYDVISGPAGVPRDWDRMRSLFAEGARLMVVVSPPGETPHVRFLTPDDQIRRAAPIVAVEDFYEVEVDRHTQTFGHVAHVLSTYECRRTPDGAPFTRQQKSLQLFNDGSRWWILSAIWHTPRSG